MPSPLHALVKRASRASVPLTLAATAAVGLLALPAAADTTHVIARGPTIEAIAHRYHVSVKAILDANHLKDTKHLKPGDTLIIPGVNPPDAKKKDGKDGARNDKPGAGPVAHKGQTPNAIAPGPRAKGPSFEEKPKQPDIVHAIRTGEEFAIRIKDKRGKIPPPAMRSFEKMMRSGSATHSIDPRLVALIGMVSNHFGGRRLEVVSGYRPFVPTQYTPHSNHNRGKALDFRIQGVPNDVLRDFCKGLRNVGVGYYPNSTFVHLDVREAPAFWVDYSRPGEPPKYDRPNVAADEGTSDVPDTEPSAPASATTPATPPATPAPAASPAEDK